MATHTAAAKGTQLKFKKSFIQDERRTNLGKALASLKINQVY
uniref:Uncharacterized protein n=1 Tax=Rhizophora mucronata TaxID=61149 RepID=A0A2P2MY30_RHIMU